MRLLFNILATSFSVSTITVFKPAEPGFSSVRASLKREIEGENIAEIKRLTETLTQMSHKLAASAYQQASPERQPYDFPAGGTHNASVGNTDEEVVDAEYEEVN
jgi:molecular chaperone DnaK